MNVENTQTDVVAVKVAWFKKRKERERERESERERERARLGIVREERRERIQWEQVHYKKKEKKRNAVSGL